MKNSILLVAGLLLSLSIFAQNNPATSLITTSGEAIVYAVPDEILLSFTITTTDDNIKGARKQNRAIAEPVIQYLKAAGIEPQHIQTQYMSMEPVKENYKTNKVLYYRASQTIAICITELGKYEEIVDQLLEREVTSIGSPRFRTTELRKKKDEARQKAIVAAKEKAELLAAALGQKIGKAHTINESAQNWASVGQGAYANVIGQDAAVSSGDGDGFALGQLEIKATVEVAFYLY